MTNIMGFALDRKKSHPCPQLRATSGIKHSVANKGTNGRLDRRICSKARMFSPWRCAIQGRRETVAGRAEGERG